MKQLPLTLDDLCVLMAAGETVLGRLPKNEKHKKLQVAIQHAKETIHHYSDALPRRVRCLQCRDWFVQPRRGNKFCSPVCSQRYRSLAYYYARKRG
jgi:hypothetical protein